MAPRNAHEQPLRLLLLRLLLLLPPLVRGGNPIVANTSIADPHIHIYDGVAYMYAGRDVSPTSTGFSMPDWHVWTSRDLVHWEHATTILPTQTYIGNSTECWAVDVARSADGSTFAFFFSHGGSDTGVMTATNPRLSDAKDALGRPLLAASNTTPPAVHVTNLTRGAYDPTVLVDDDAATYLCLGLRLGGSYLIARLEPTLVALAEEPRAIVVLPDPVTGATMPGDDKSTLHKHVDTYYLSAGAWYATASSVYGPYTFRGSSSPQVTRGNTSRTFGLTHQAHGRYFTFRGQWFHVWCEFISENNTGTKDPGSPNYRYRDSWMVYTHYLENGEMEDDWNFLDAHGPAGVGQYDARWERIEAEWFMVGTNVEKVQTNAGSATNNTDAAFAVRFNTASSALGFPSVANLPAHGTLTLQLQLGGVPPRGGGSEAQGAGGVLAVYAQDKSGGSRGTLLASCSLTGRARVTCPLKVPGGIATGSSSSSSSSSGTSTSTDLMFVYEPVPSVAGGASGAAGVLLDSWSVAAAASV